MKKLFLILAFSTTLYGQTYEVVQNDKNKAEFLGEAILGVVSIPGEGGKVSGSAKVEKGMISGTFEVDVSKMETGLSLRDSHMHEKYMQTKKYPKVKLVLDPVKLQEKMDFSGKLTVKNQTKPVKGKAVYKNNIVKAEFNVSLKQYPAIGVPSYADVAMADKVEVKIEFEVKQK